MSNFETEYRAKLNRKALTLLAAHLPACAALAGFEGINVWFAVVVGALLLAGPAALFATGRARTSTSVSIAVSSMGSAHYSFISAGG